jgi:multiple sugar transport system permease protein
MMVPQESLRFAMEMFFKLFGTSNPIGMFLKSIGVIETGFVNTLIPQYILAFTGLGFKNGLYIFMMRQFFTGVPDELEESAYVDGSNTFRTFFQIILPLSVPMMITIFLFSFCWQWTDDFYVPLFYLKMPHPDFMVFLTDNISDFTSLMADFGSSMPTAVTFGCGLMACIPLIILFLFCQKYLVQGIERSGIIG